MSKALPRTLGEQHTARVTRTHVLLEYKLSLVVAENIHVKMLSLGAWTNRTDIRHKKCMALRPFDTFIHFLRVRVVLPPYVRCVFGALHYNCNYNFVVCVSQSVYLHLYIIALFIRQFMRGLDFAPRNGTCYGMRTWYYWFYYINNECFLYVSRKRAGVTYTPVILSKGYDGCYHVSIYPMHGSAD